MPDRGDESCPDGLVSYIAAITVSAVEAESLAAFWSELLTLGNSMSNGLRLPRRPKISAFIVGIIVLLGISVATVSGGVGGALIVLASAVAVTGLYLLATRGRSWAWLPSGRKTGAIVLASSLTLS